MSQDPDKCKVKFFNFMLLPKIVQYFGQKENVGQFSYKRLMGLYQEKNHAFYSIGSLGFLL